MSKGKSKLLYYKSIIRKDRLVEGLKKLEDETQRLELLELYVIHFHLVGIFELGIKDIDDLLLKLSKEKRHYITYRENDYLYLKDYGQKELLISMFYTRNIEDAKDMVLLTGVYDNSILLDIKEHIGLEPLVQLYKNKENEDILNIAYTWDDSIELYKKFLYCVDDAWIDKLIDKIINNCKISDILEEYKIFSTNNLIKIWSSHYDSLTSENVYDIFRTVSYNKDDITKLLDILLKEKNPYYLCLILTGSDLIPLSIDELKKLEQALRSTKSIEYNLYYNYYKYKDKLIQKFGSKIALVVYLHKNRDLFKNSYEYAVIINNLENEIMFDADNVIDQDQINSFLFRDFEEEKENTKKIVKKEKKD